MWQLVCGCLINCYFVWEYGNMLCYSTVSTDVVRASKCLLLYYLILKPCLEEGQCVMCLCGAYSSINLCLIKLYSRSDAISYSSTGILYTMLREWEKRGVQWGPAAHLCPGTPSQVSPSMQLDVWIGDCLLTCSLGLYKAIIHHLLCFQLTQVAQKIN